jgi:uncharacterized protein YuzE
MPPPTIEIDPVAQAAYVRFSNRKVAKTKTLAVQNRNINVAVDFDADSNVIGIEIVGVTEFSVRTIAGLLPPGAKRIDMSRARFVPAAAYSSVEAA